MDTSEALYGGINDEQKISCIQYVELNATSGLSDYHSDIAQISMAIQKSKYDGSDEKFNDWVVRLDAENSCCDSTLAEEPQNEVNHK